VAETLTEERVSPRRVCVAVTAAEAERVRDGDGSRVADVDALADGDGDPDNDAVHDGDADGVPEGGDREADMADDVLCVTFGGDTVGSAVRVSACVCVALGTSAVPLRLRL
jgi:hypothetical protein